MVREIQGKERIVVGIACFAYQNNIDDNLHTEGTKANRNRGKIDAMDVNEKGREAEQ